MEYAYRKADICKPKNCLSSWKWLFSGSDAEYCALFPRAWTVYNIPEQKIRLVCRQVSPVIPHNYKDSSVPGAVFIWSVENRNDEVRKVSITFTFKNGNGGEEDRAGGCWSESFHQPGHGGVLIHQSFKGMPCTYGIAGSEKNGSTVSWITKFDPWSDGSELWDKLNKFGHLNDHSESSEKLEPGKELACAVCVKCEVPKNEISEAELALVWDMPKIHFVLGCRQYSRYYTKYFGDDGNASMKLIKYVFENSARWEKEIDNWQRPILTDVELPDWYKSAIFNELYYVADGGSIWLLPHESNELGASDPRQVYGHFGYLEGHEYTMYNTYDVHFYASFALALLWPRLQESIQYEILETIGSEDTSMRWHLYDGKRNFRKVKNSVPHDVGDPYEEPFILINAYPIHDVSEWKDLNLKFVLQCYRDYCLFADEQYVKNMWPKVQIVMHKAMEWDKDGDGLIENGGMPDQTYDSWVMKGPSAYCGSLWLAALYSARKMAEVMNDVDQAALYEETLKKAKGAFETKLWNGEYYNFDSSSDTNSRSIMSDQLCGLWYLRACGVTEEVFNGKHVASALRKIFDFNVMKFKNGTMGAVNGMTPDGKIDMVTVQSEEAWTGVVYGLAALMLHEGMVEEAFKTAHGIYNTVYNTIGMGFETPEALYVEKSYRAVGYMRPLSIWGIQHAWEQRQKKKLP
ncbi:non-lysosomal glucosylceramidase isoform X2 [Anabrus simplex]|uniref:non-lysosomal glucosylceramidase isoform X2 n=1 Tax=Anabrus simplex TaxID=316456 RepID=UPI0035A36CD0